MYRFAIAVLSVHSSWQCVTFMHCVEIDKHIVRCFSHQLSMLFIKAGTFLSYLLFMANGPFKLQQ